MIFTSYTYVAFLFAVFLLHWIAPISWRKPILIIASYVFYCSWKWQYGFLLLGVTFFNWSYGRWVLAKATSGPRLAFGILINLAPLLYYKYAGFLVSNYTGLLGLLGIPDHIHIPSIILPLGISFFTFQGIAYLIEVAGGEEPIRRLVNFMLFKAFWPQLIAGPIIRPGEMHWQLLTPRTLSYANFAFGGRRILAGFFKKVVLADTLAPFVDMAFLPGASVNAIDVAVGTIGFGLQIYFDFSGYSDIAIGTARLFGFVFPENFDWPYLARSPQEFWTRWHMTLTRWIRDYIFTPLTFAARRHPNSWPVWLLVAMAACGLWHGAQWTFVCWGVWHGLLLVANHTVFRRLFPQPSASRDQTFGWRGIFCCAVTFGLVTLGWILFRAESLAQAWSMTHALLTLKGGYRPAVIRENIVLIVLAILAGMAALAALNRISRDFIVRWRTWQVVEDVLKPIVFASMIIAVIVFDSEAKAFVYFQF